MIRISRRRLLAASAAALSTRVLPAAAQGSAPLRLDDASRLNATPVARHLRPAVSATSGWLDTMRGEIRSAAAEGRPVSVSAARHSMGGQSLPRNGLAVTLDVDAAAVPGLLTVDGTRKTYRAHSGLRWKQVVAALDPLVLSPLVMQSNNDFGVGSTISVNAHGWPAPFGPMGSTARSFRLLMASGEIVTCSPTENVDLYRLVIGGYGLLGVIIDAELELTDNVLLRPKFELMPASEIGRRFADVLARDPEVWMAYGRLSVDARSFLRESMLVTFRPRAGAPPPVSSGGLLTTLSREVFRAQIGSETAKRARWHVETVLAPAAAAGDASRNRLLNEPVANLAGRDKARTDILHEYFLPPEGLEPFLAACRTIMPKSRQDLLNVTLRFIKQDASSVMAFARSDVVGAVMLFSQRMTQADDDDMRNMTVQLVDAALAAGGTFYLPYRLHARPDQVARAFPRLEEFVAQKRRYDPQLLFRNLMWDQYFTGRG